MLAALRSSGSVVAGAVATRPPKNVVEAAILLVHHGQDASVHGDHGALASADAVITAMGDGAAAAPCLGLDKWNAEAFVAAGGVDGLLAVLDRCRPFNPTPAPTRPAPPVDTAVAVLQTLTAVLECREYGVPVDQCSEQQPAPAAPAAAPAIDITARLRSWNGVQASSGRKVLKVPASVSWQQPGAGPSIVPCRCGDFPTRGAGETTLQPCDGRPAVLSVLSQLGG